MEQGFAVAAPRKARPVAVLAESVYLSVLDKETANHFPALEPDDFLAVPANDRLRAGRPVRIKVSVNVSVHVRSVTDICPRSAGYGKYLLHVLVDIDPERLIVSCRISLPEIAGGEFHSRNEDCGVSFLVIFR